MQIYTIVIGGLEKSYMQKLVLYLNERLGKSARVELLEHWEIPEQPEVWEMKIYIIKSLFLSILSMQVTG